MIDGVVKTPQEFLEADCQLARPRFDIFAAVYQQTGGDPCRTGCAFFESGKCEAFRKLFPIAAATRDKMRIEDERIMRTEQKKGRIQGPGGYAAPSKKPFRW